MQTATEGIIRIRVTVRENTVEEYILATEVSTTTENLKGPEDLFLLEWRDLGHELFKAMRQQFLNKHPMAAHFTVATARKKSKGKLWKQYSAS